MPWIGPVFDRNEDDVSTATRIISEVNANGYNSLSVEDKALFDSGLKACRNYIDLNRIENNCDYLGNILGLSLTTDTSWTVSKTPLESDIQRICDNVDAIKNAMQSIVPVYIPEVPALPINTIYKMNALEEILYMVDYVYNQMIRWDDLDEINETWDELDSKQLLWQDYYLKEE
jgi:hypothetical protein